MLVLVLAMPASGDGAVAWIASPSGNITCQISNRYAGSTDVYCQSERVPESVTMGIKGRLRICRGQRCLGNAPADSTVTLGFGKSRAVGPFRCTSLRQGVRCVVTATSRGFVIDRRTIAPVTP